MKTKTKASLGALVIAASVLFYSAMPVGAQTTTETEQFNSLVERIAEKLNMDTADVKAVFEEVHKEKQSSHKSKLDLRLSEAAAKGVITEDQKAQLVLKFDELTTTHGENREVWMSLSPEERQSKLLLQQQELEQWASDHGITAETLKKIGFGVGRGWKQGFKAGFWLESR